LRFDKTQLAFIAKNSWRFSRTGCSLFDFCVLKIKRKQAEVCSTEDTLPTESSAVRFHGVYSGGLRFSIVKNAGKKSTKAPVSAPAAVFP
jgi:hypothetical protein